MRRPRTVHLVGGLPLLDDREVFLLQTETLDDRLRCYVGRHVPAEPDPTSDSAEPASAGQLNGGRVAAAALAGPSRTRTSYAAFRDLKRDRWIPGDRRIQIELAAEAGWAGCDPSAEPAAAEFVSADRLAATVRELADIVPAEDLALQITLSVVQFRTITADRPAADVRRVQQTITEAARQAVDAVPPRIDVALHLNCGSGAQYKIRPADMRLMVELANDVIPAAKRPVDLLHFPVPLAHQDDEFFRSLDDLLDLGHASLCLGLVHLSDGLDGAKRRIDFALPHAPRFTVAARSGFADRPPETLRGFLLLHAEVADALLS